MMTKPDFSFENLYESPCAGVDEAGCGPWAGPVVAAAAILCADNITPDLLCLINDSKKLTAKTREKIVDLFEQERNKNIYYATGMATVEEIDALNIGQATRLAMERAIENLPLKPTVALIDGIRKPNLSIPIQLIKKGDTLSLSIAAASIIAKTTRDRLMALLHEEYPAYGWNQNAGYGTAHHHNALKSYGVTQHHRRSFAPIRALV